MATDPSNYLTMDGAAQLARRVRDYWYEKGHYTVGVWVEPIRVVMQGEQTPKTAYQIRSNLKNGLPPKKNIADVIS